MLLWAILGMAAAIVGNDADAKPIHCDGCAAWNAPHKPFRLFGNAYFVGPEGLGSVLITSDAGHVLIDGALPQSAEIVADNVRTLGFRIEDVKWILSSHAHFDHAGGIAALAKRSGAAVAASKRSAEILRLGTVSSDDPQVGYGAAMDFPKVKSVRELSDGEELVLGTLRIRTHYTAGHTPGATSYGWESCEGKKCLRMVYADSLNPVSAPGFRFSQHPQLVTQFRTSIATMKALPCDVIVSAHPDQSSLFERDAKRSARKAAEEDPIVDPTGCQKYATEAAARLDKRLAEEARDAKTKK